LKQAKSLSIHKLYHYLVAGSGISKYHCHMRPKPIPKASSKGS
jgi:hypothetical protein